MATLREHAQGLRDLLINLTTLTQASLVELFRLLGEEPDFPTLLEAAFPDLVLPYAHAAADITAAWYDDLDPEARFRAEPIVDLPADRMNSSISWALNASGGDTTSLDRLAGSTKRMVLDASRGTVIANTEREGVKWARHASANACAFCRLMATRGAVYTSKAGATRVVGRREQPSGTQSLGDRYHDHCHCIALPVRAGQTYEPPSYVAQWERQYAEARKSGARDPKAILAHMRRQERPAATAAQ